MLYYSIDKLREILVEELSKVEIEKPILLPFDKGLLRKIIFDDDRFDSSLTNILFKIDFSNISFDGYNLQDGVNNFKGSKGAKIDPQTVKDKDFYRTNCADVEFIGSFDGVKRTLTKLEGSNYEEIINFEKDFREKIKSLVLKKSNNK